MFAQFDQATQTEEDAAGYAGRVVASCITFGFACRAMHPATVAGLAGVVDVGRVVEAADLVAEVDQRNATGGQGDAVEQQQTGDGVRVILLKSAQRRRGAADAAVAGGRVVLERDAARETAGKAIDEETVEELAVIEAVNLPK